MAYKSLFTVVTDAALVPQTLADAETIASAQGAHLDVLCLGVDRTQPGYYYGSAAAIALHDMMGHVAEEAKALEAQVRQVLRQSQVLWTAERAVASLADVGRHVAARARFCDLVTLPLPYGTDIGIEMEPVIEGALFDGGVPVLALPASADVATAPRVVAVAWNESPEALRAVKAALPLLQSAQLVHIVVVDPPQHGLSRSDPGGMLAQFLARHGVRAEVRVVSKSLPRVSEILQREVRDVGAEMLVMGAYGHSRFREAILGGATRNMLEMSDVPVFLTH